MNIEIAPNLHESRSEIDTDVLKGPPYSTEPGFYAQFNKYEILDYIHIIIVLFNVFNMNIASPYY